MALRDGGQYWYGDSAADVREVLARPYHGALPCTHFADVVCECGGRVFDIQEVVSWDAKLVTLPDRRAARLFLRGRGLSEEAAAECAVELSMPVTITKRGSLVWARKRPLCSY